MTLRVMARSCPRAVGDCTVIFAGLFAAISWDLITWYYGLPTSSSHALFGGYAGAAVAKAGFAAVIVSGWTRTILFIFLAPVVGMSVGLIMMVGSLWVFRSSRVPHTYLEFSEAPSAAAHRARASRPPEELELETRVRALATYAPESWELWEEIPFAGSGSSGP